MASLTECLYHATPLLAIPFANDQKQHMMRAQRLGYAAFVDWEGLSTVGLLVALKTTLEDKQMAARLQQVRSYCMCCVPMMISNMENVSAVCISMFKGKNSVHGQREESAFSRRLVD